MRNTVCCSLCLSLVVALAYHTEVEAVRIDQMMAVLLEAVASCRGRCGDGYYRGSTCQCDYSCLRYGECCRDYESLCTTKNSCKGRCGEGFRRGRKCSCDEECIKYKQCCPDYNDYCDKGATTVPSTPPAATTLESKPTEPTKPDLDKPIPEPDTNPGDYQADDSNDTNLCSGRPISGVTTLRNGTVVVFRGQYFWFLDPNRVPGPARDITQVWGVPSPIDTVFTRCNCQGKTYIFKGGKYWRFENDALDSGYPKVVETGFDGLKGPITAALSVPQHRSRREAVYFFKRGGTVQKYSYQSGTRPTCGQKPHFTIHTVHNRRVRQAVSVLEAAINIRTNWRGFPQTVTAAVSVPDKREAEGYKYYVFSGSKSYKVRMDGGHPVMESPKPASFIKCPNAV
ncbi:proteoglycan 4-like [Neosynchiropus ocellatus]